LCINRNDILVGDNYNNDGGTRNGVVWILLLQEGVPPNVTDLRPVASTTFNISDIIEIAANVTDNVGVDIVFANVTFPNGTTQQVILSNVVGSKYNNSFTVPLLVGQYNITFEANDTNGNLNATEITFFVGGGAIIIGNVILNATSVNNLTTDNLTVALAVVPSDASIQYDWYRNGSLDAVFLGNATFQNTLPSSFTSLGDVWQVNATPKILVDNYDVSTGAYVDNLSVFSENNVPSDIAFNNDGTKLYVVGDTSDEINEYNLSVAFDVSTGVANDLLTVSSEDSEPRDIMFNNDGTKLYVLGDFGNEINEYNLSPAFDVSTGVANDLLSISAQETNSRGMTFNNDGTKLYVIGEPGSTIYEYNLSVAFDVSTGVFDSGFNVSAQELSSWDVAFNNDGTKLYVLGIGSGDEKVTEYNLSVAFDVSTGVVNDNFSVDAQVNGARGMEFNNDGTKLYVIGAEDDEVSEYDIGTGSSGITVLSSIE